MLSTKINRAIHTRPFTVYTPYLVDMYERGMAIWACTLLYTDVPSSVYCLVKADHAQSCKIHTWCVALKILSSVHTKQCKQ